MTSPDAAPYIHMPLNSDGDRTPARAMSTENKHSLLTSPPRAHHGQRTPSTRPTYEVRDLMGDAREALLVHQGEHYRLRVTANDKLILTK